MMMFETFSLRSTVYIWHIVPEYRQNISPLPGKYELLPCPMSWEAKKVP